MPNFKIVRDGKVIGAASGSDKDAVKAFYAKTVRMFEDSFDVELDDEHPATVEEDSFGETLN